MAEDSEQIKHEGEVENPKSEDSPPPPPPPANTADVRRPSSPTSSFTNFSVNIWPPSQRTRDAVITRLIENLSTPSVLSKRYGTLPPEESSAIARQIEDEAFAVASASAATAAAPPLAANGDEVGSVEASVDEGIQILHIYSKEISRRMIDSVKLKAYSGYLASAKENDGEVAESVSTPADNTGEEIASEEVQPMNG